MLDIRRWAGGRRMGRVSGLTMPSNIGNQVVCTIGQTDGHSSPDHTMSRADNEWSSLGPQATLLMHPSGPTGSVLVLHGLIGLQKAVCKSRPSIYGNCVTVSG